MKTDRRTLSHYTDGCVEYNKNEHYTLDEVIEKLELFKKEGNTHVSFSAYGGYDGEVDEIEMQPVVRRLETDEEYQERIDAEIARNINSMREREKNQRAEYLRLKKKYEG